MEFLNHLQSSSENNVTTYSKHSINNTESIANTNDNDDLLCNKSAAENILNINNLILKYSTTSTVYADQSITQPDFDKILYWYLFITIISY